MNDNLSKRSEVPLKRAQEVASEPLRFVGVDLRNAGDLACAFEGLPEEVVHFAALKALGASREKQQDYLGNIRRITLLWAIRLINVRNRGRSCSATANGEPNAAPVAKGAPLPLNNSLRVYSRGSLRDFEQPDAMPGPRSQSWRTTDLVMSVLSVFPIGDVFRYPFGRAR